MLTNFDWICTSCETKHLAQLGDPNHKIKWRHTNIGDYSGRASFSGSMACPSCGAQHEYCFSVLVDLFKPDEFSNKQ